MKDIELHIRRGRFTESGKKSNRTRELTSLESNALPYRLGIWVAMKWNNLDFSFRVEYNIK